MSSYIVKNDSCTLLNQPFFTCLEGEPNLCGHDPLLKTRAEVKLKSNEPVVRTRFIFNPYWNLQSVSPALWRLRHRFKHV